MSNYIQRNQIKVASPEIAGTIQPIQEAEALIEETPKTLPTDYHEGELLVDDTPASNVLVLQQEGPPQTKNVKKANDQDDHSSSESESLDSESESDDDEEEEKIDDAIKRSSGTSAIQPGKPDGVRPKKSFKDIYLSSKNIDEIGEAVRSNQKQSFKIKYRSTLVVAKD